MIDELHSSDIQRYQMEGDGGVTQSTIDEILSWDSQRDQIEGESGVTRSIIHELHSWDIQGDQMEDLFLPFFKYLDTALATENKILRFSRAVLPYKTRSSNGNLVLILYFRGETS